MPKLRQLTSSELKTAHHQIRKGGVVMAEDRLLSLEARIIELEKGQKSLKQIVSRAAKAIKTLRGE